MYAIYVVYLHSLAEREQDLSETGFMTAVNLSSILHLVCFWVVISWLPFTLELIHGHAKCQLIDLWIYLSFNNLITGHNGMLCHALGPSGGK